MDIIKVSGSSRTSAVAGAIAGVFRENHHAEVQAIGAGAVNQAVKALVLATGYLAEDGLDVVFVPEFVDVEIDGKTRTAVRMVVQPRSGLEKSSDEAEVPAFAEEPAPAFDGEFEEEVDTDAFAAPEPEEDAGQDAFSTHTPEEDKGRDPFAPFPSDPFSTGR